MKAMTPFYPLFCQREYELSGEAPIFAAPKTCHQKWALTEIP